MAGIAGFYQTEFDYRQDRKWCRILDKMKESLLHRGNGLSGMLLETHIGLVQTGIPVEEGSAFSAGSTADGCFALSAGLTADGYFTLSAGSTTGGCSVLSTDSTTDEYSVSSAGSTAETGLVLCPNRKGYPSVKRGDGRTVGIVFDGELYNVKELRQLLLTRSGTGDAGCDAEIILNGYWALGSDFFKELNGVFAFAIYDSYREQLLLCRDRLGARPLFYSHTTESLIFGSEAKALFAYGLRPQVDRESFGEIFGVGPARTLGKGVFKDIREVLPGHFLVIRDKQAESFAYWQLQGRAHRDSYEETVAQISFLVTDSIKRQSVAEVPISCFLSGGLDSSVVSAVCAGELAREGKRLSTFSFDFTGNSENFKANSFQASLDRPFVDIMVSHLGSHHTYLNCDSITQADYLEKAVDAADLPGMGDIEASLLYFCEKVAAQNRVALTGEGADEIFGGYPWFHRKPVMTDGHFLEYSAERLPQGKLLSAKNQSKETELVQKEGVEKEGFPWSNDMSFRTALLTEDFISEIEPADYARQAYEKSKAETPRYEGDSPADAKRREISWLTLRWFLVTLLNRLDRTSMYGGIRARTPFGDHRLVEYLYNVPWAMKCPGGINKNLLIEASRKLLPEEVLFRKKSPYPKTYDPAYEKLLGERLRTVLAAGNSPLLGIVDKQKIAQFLCCPSDYGKPWYGQLMAGPQMLAYLLQVDYWMKKYRL